MLVGSRAFFEGLNDFKSKDTDILELVDNPIGFKNQRQFKFKDKCVFQWRRMPVNEFISVTLSNNVPMEVGKFLVPEFIEVMNITLDDLKKLEPLFNKLDDKHKYEKIIYDSYMSNRNFVLTEDQLNEAYKEYLKYRT